MRLPEGGQRREARSAMADARHRPTICSRPRARAWGRWEPLRTSGSLSRRSMNCGSFDSSFAGERRDSVILALCQNWVPSLIGHEAHARSRRSTRVQSITAQLQSAAGTPRLGAGTLRRGQSVSLLLGGVAL